MKNMVKSYRRIENWENFFLDSAVYSAAVALGVECPDGFTTIAAVTGDLFTVLYSDVKPCDSGLTNYFIDPDTVVRAFSSFGYACKCFSKEDFAANPNAVLTEIRASVDRGIPVVLWGAGGVVMADGTRYDPLGEGALIGGYDGDVLYVHLYPGAQRLSNTAFDGTPGVDEYGYTRIPAEHALASTNGIFIAGEKLTTYNPESVCRDTVKWIPHWLTLPEKDGYAFGEAAFVKWAAVLMDDRNWNSPELCEENVWEKHCCAYCSLCTSIGVGDGAGCAVEYLKRAADVCPDMAVLPKILPIYEKLHTLVQKIWEIHRGFMPDVANMSRHAYRASLAAVLSEMGTCCDEITMAFEGTNV